MYVCVFSALSYAASSLVLLFYCLVSCSLTTQEFTAEISKHAKDFQRAVRQCENPLCEVTAKDNIPLHKCPRCRVTLYCCKDHAAQHLPAHLRFCRELTRRCDFPECTKRAQIKCGRCKVATYCGARHMSKHSSAHESVCEELRACRR